MLANIYLHYVFDLWVQRWRTKRASGDVVIVRYADDFIVGFENYSEAKAFLSELKGRFAEFGLELHPEKTRLIEFGRYAAANRSRRGRRKPETFNFLGFTHCCSKNRKGLFTVLRLTMRQRQQGKLAMVRNELWRRMHAPIQSQGAYLRSVLLGHYQYYGVPRNSRKLRTFRMEVGKIWTKLLRRRSQRHCLPWERLKEYVTKWLPMPHICHPYPGARFNVRYSR